MPIEQRTGAQQLRALAFVLLGIAATIAIGVGLAGMGSGRSGRSAVQLGSDRFRVGDAKVRSADISRDGPILFSDVSGRGQLKPVFVSHTGVDPETGWVVFSAQAPGVDGDCFLQWDPTSEVFRSRRGRNGPVCDPRTFPAWGEGLVRYTAEVDRKGVLWIDLAAPAATTTTTGATLPAASPTSTPSPSTTAS